MQISTFAIAVALAAPVAAQAQEAVMTPAAFDPGNSIIVTGVLADDDTPINPVRLPRSARISSETLDEEDVDRRQARDVYDLLNYGTGVFTTTSGRKAPANLNIRGDGNFAFVIDGAYVPPQMASRILQAIPAEAIAEVRIVRTSTALTVNPLVGIVSPSGAANNGFVVVRTKEPRETEATLRLFGGSFGTAGGNLRAGTRFDLAGGEAYVQVIGSTYTTDGPDGYNIDKDYTLAGIKAGLDLGAVALDLSVMQSWAEYGIVNGNARLRPGVDDDIWRMDPIDTLIATANGTVRWDEHNTTLVTAAWTDSAADFITSDLLPSGALANTLSRDNDNSFFNTGLRHNLFFGDTNFQAGVDYIHWKNPSGQYYYEGIPREEEVTGFFLQADQTLFEGALTLDLGGRLDRVTVIRGIDYFQAGRGPNANVRIITDETLPYAKFLSSGASLRVAGDWLVNARYGFSTQGPRRGVVLANPAVELQGEKRNKFELGVEGRVADWLRPSINGFYIDVKDEVQPISYAVVAGEQVGLYGNTDSRRTGAEAVLQGRWGNPMENEGSYRASVTHYFDVLDPSGLLARTQPRTVAEFTFDQAWQGWQVSGAAKYVSRYESNAFTACAAPNPNCNGGVQGPFLPIGDFLTADLALSRQVTLEDLALRVTFSVKNLTDEYYETTVGFPSIGRQFGVELFTAF